MSAPRIPHTSSTLDTHRTRKVVIEPSGNLKPNDVGPYMSAATADHGTVPDIVAYWEPKASTDRSDWEDGFAYDVSSGWFAVADGASAGIHSREWAHTLARCIVEDRPDGLLAPGATGEDLVAWLRSVRDRFDPDDPEFPTPSMPAWVRDAGRRGGSFATLVAGRIDSSGWAAVAVGDCCLFHVGRENQLLLAFPVQRAADLGATPDLLTSVEIADSNIAAARSSACGSLGLGEALFAASDALAAWLLDQGQEPATWATLRRIGRVGFSFLCEGLRDRGQVRNDDMTLLRWCPALDPAVQ